MSLPDPETLAASGLVVGLLNLCGTWLKSLERVRDEAIALILVGGSAAGHALVMPDWRAGLFQGAMTAFTAISLHQLKRQTTKLVRNKAESGEQKPETRKRKAEIRDPNSED